MRSLTGVLVFGLLAAGCAGPVARIDAEIARTGYTKELRLGMRYRHVVLDNGVRDPAQPLAVYLEGDGSPYRGRYLVTSEPTSRRPLMLELMRSESAPAVYVGRPCYLGLATDSPCTPRDWTTGRFAEEIVASMCAVIERLALERGDVPVALYGHSGGGALAVLIARRLERVQRVVTLAGNLDPAAWTALHRYAPLTDSLDPLAGGALPARIAQLHVAGAEDENIPPTMIASAAQQLGAANVLVLPGVTHASGWYDHWPALRAGQ